MLCLLRIQGRGEAVGPTVKALDRKPYFSPQGVKGVNKEFLSEIDAEFSYGGDFG